MNSGESRGGNHKHERGTKMANKSIFSPSGGRQVKATDTVNEAGGRAYKKTDRHALAQYACTGTFTGTFYASAKDQLDTTMKLARQCDPVFVGKTAVYARENSFMKDMPAFLVASLAARQTPEATEVLRAVFPRVMDNGKMVRNFVQMVRSGVLGRNSMGTVSKQLINEWFERKSPYNLFVNSIGNDPSLAEVMRMTHPKPNTDEKAALFAYIMGAERQDGQLVVRGRRRVNGKKTKEIATFYTHDFDALPQVVKDYEDAKANGYNGQAGIPFQFLDSLELSDKQWADIARSMTWQQTRMNLNTLDRHGAFKDREIVELVAERLRNEEEIAKARVFPYQLMMAYQMTTSVPFEVREALQDAMEIATKNVPAMGKVYVAIDVSGSMGSPVTGRRGTATTKVRCVDVAALFGASVLRTNRDAEVIPFAETVRQAQFNPRDTVATNAQKCAGMWGGGTNCSAVLQWLNQRKATGDAVVYVSDYESWVDGRRHYYYGNQGTAMMNEWNSFKRRNQDAKLVCIDLTPYNTGQVEEKKDILQVGGFSDQVFNVVAAFIEGGNSENYWVDVIDSVEL